jgi:hypothetical protein
VRERGKEREIAVEEIYCEVDAEREKEREGERGRERERASERERANSANLRESTK